MLKELIVSVGVRIGSAPTMSSLLMSRVNVQGELKWVYSMLTTVSTMINFQSILTTAIQKVPYILGFN